MCTNNALRPESRWRIVASWIPSTPGWRKTVVVTSVIFTSVPCTFAPPPRASTLSAYWGTADAEPFLAVHHVVGTPSPRRGERGPYRLEASDTASPLEGRGREERAGEGW